MVRCRKELQEATLFSQYHLQQSWKQERQPPCDKPRNHWLNFLSLPIWVSAAASVHFILIMCVCAIKTKCLGALPLACANATTIRCMVTNGLRPGHQHVACDFNHWLDSRMCFWTCIGERAPPGGWKSLVEGVSNLAQDRLTEMFSTQSHVKHLVQQPENLHQQKRKGTAFSETLGLASETSIIFNDMSICEHLLLRIGQQHINHVPSNGATTQMIASLHGFCHRWVGTGTISISRVQSDDVGNSFPFFWLILSIGDTLARYWDNLAYAAMLGWPFLRDFTSTLWYKILPFLKNFWNFYFREDYDFYVANYEKPIIGELFFAKT